MSFEDLDAYNAIVQAKFWSGYDEYGSTKDENAVATHSGFRITLVEKYNAADATWKRENSGYYTSEGRQGWSGTSHLIFKVVKGGEERFYKKEGTCSSYGYDSWDGTFKRVVATPKTIEVWEYK